MSRLQWDETGKRKYENGISHGVLYTQYPTVTKDNSYAAPVTRLNAYDPADSEHSGYLTFYAYTADARYAEFDVYPACYGTDPPIRWEGVDDLESCIEYDFSVMPPLQRTVWYRTSIKVSRSEIEGITGSRANANAKFSRVINESVGGSSNIEVVNCSTYDDQIPGFPMVRADYKNGTAIGARFVVSVVYVSEMFGSTSVRDLTKSPFIAVAWNGLTNVSENPDGAEANDLWADNMKYSSPRSKEEFGMTIEAYTYPDDFALCDGTKQLVKGVKFGQQSRLPFCMSYRTEVGNDTASESDGGYLLHLVYNCTASPSDRSYETINDSPDAITFSWECESIPEKINNYDYYPVSTITIDSRKAKELVVEEYSSNVLEVIETYLYGADGYAGVMPSPDFIIWLFKRYAISDGN